MALARSTPGSARSRSAPSRTRRSTASEEAKRGSATDMRSVTVRSTSNPGSTRWSAIAVRMSRAEPTRSTRASAISLTTIAARARRCFDPLPVRPPPSLSIAVRSARDDCHAGSDPKRRPVAIDTIRVNSSTRQSRPTLEPSSPMRGRPAVLTASSARIPTKPNAQPSVPPRSDSTMLSVRSWRAMRRRDPPSALRSATSRSRAVARASRR